MVQPVEPVVDEPAPTEVTAEMPAEAPAPDPVMVVVPAPAPAPAPAPVVEVQPPPVLPFLDINAAAAQAFADHLAMVEASKMREKDAQTLVSRIKVDKAAMTSRHDQEAMELNTRHHQELATMTTRASDASDDAAQAALDTEDTVRASKDAGRALITVIQGYVGS